MIWYFWKSLRPLVRVKIEQQGQEFDSFKELVEKTVNAKVKATLPPYFYTCKTDQYCA